MKRVTPVLAGAAALLMASVVWAQNGDAPSENAITRITEIAFQIITPIAVIFATWLAHRLIGIFEKKTKIDIPDAQEAQLDKWIDEGIHLAAEKAHQKIKAKTETLSGNEKLEEAADFAFDLAATRGWIEWSKDRIKNKIEAKLGLTRGAP